MYRNTFQPTGNVNTRRRYRIVLLLCFLFFVATVVLAFQVGGNSAFRTNTDNQLQQRTRNAIASAIDEVNRIDGSVNSETALKLAKVRQHIYLAEQLSSMSVSLSGEGARLIPSDFFTTVYGTLNDFQTKLATATSSVNDVKTALLTQLQNAQYYLNAQ